MTELIELKKEDKKSLLTRILPSDILKARKLNMIRRRIEDALKSRTKALFLSIIDSNGSADLIPYPDIDNLEKLFSDIGILTRLPEKHVKAIIRNIPDDVYDDLLSFIETSGKTDLFQKLVMLARKFKGGRWP